MLDRREQIFCLTVVKRLGNDEDALGFLIPMPWFPSARGAFPTLQVHATKLTLSPHCRSTPPNSSSFPTRQVHATKLIRFPFFLFLILVSYNTSNYILPSLHSPLSLSSPHLTSSPDPLLVCFYTFRKRAGLQGICIS